MCFKFFCAYGVERGEKGGPSGRVSLLRENSASVGWFMSNLHNEAVTPVLYGSALGTCKDKLSGVAQVVRDCQPCPGWMHHPRCLLSDSASPPAFRSATPLPLCGVFLRRI